MCVLGVLMCSSSVDAVLLGSRGCAVPLLCPSELTSVLFTGELLLLRLGFAL